MDIDNQNFKALYAFTKQIKNHLGENKKVKMANVGVRYHLTSGVREIDTTIMISLDNQPNSTFELIPQGWMNSEFFYTGFNAGYNEFIFDPAAGTLTIICKSSSKLGFYKVEIIEIA